MRYRYRRSRPAIDRILDRTTVEPDDGCWRCSLGLSARGYTQVELLGGKRHPGHVVSYEHFKGLVPEGLELHHTCEVRACVNPAHLVPITRAEHRRLHEASKTHCVQGHAFDVANTRIDKRGWRKCRQCERESSREGQRRRRSRAA